MLTEGEALMNLFEPTKTSPSLSPHFLLNFERGNKDSKVSKVRQTTIAFQMNAASLSTLTSDYQLEPLECPA